MTPAEARQRAVRAAQKAAFDEAIEAYWAAQGGTIGGLRAAIAAYEAALWQPIDTAPRDGTSIEVVNDRGRFVVAWDDDWWQVYDGKMDHPLRGNVPTHWRPLPAGPGDAT